MKLNRMTGMRRGCAVGLPLLLVLLAFVRAIPVEGQDRNPFRNKKLYVDPLSPSSKQASAWQRSRPKDAALIRKIADQPQAIWLGDWMHDIRREADAIVTRIARTGALPVLVVYNIPYRDCGLYSSGGARGADAYRRWIIELTRGLKGRPTVIILEPDGLAANDCLPLRLKDERYVLIREAVQALEGGGAAVYIDAGNANWQQADEIASRLRKAGVEAAHGFALNVSNFHATSVNITYGNRLSALLAGKHYVIDTSRNGVGSPVEKEWCNARNQALGLAPTTDTKQPLVDAFLWVKTPGQSDGTCGGGPRAGDWWPDYALELSKMAEVLGSMVPK